MSITLNKVVYACGGKKNNSLKLLKEDKMLINI